MKLTRLQAKEAIYKLGGNFFTVTFIKKDGSLRVMNCRKGVKKGVKGVGLAFNPADYDLMPVFDMQNDGYRMINFATIQQLTINKQTWVVA